MQTCKCWFFAPITRRKFKSLHLSWPTFLMIPPCTDLYCLENRLSSSQSGSWFNFSWEFVLELRPDEPGVFVLYPDEVREATDHLLPLERLKIRSCKEITKQSFIFILCCEAGRNAKFQFLLSMGIERHSLARPFFIHDYAMSLLFEKVSKITLGKTEKLRLSSPSNKRPS